MPTPYPKEFNENVVRVAQQRGHEVTIAEIAKDFGAGGGGDAPGCYLFRTSPDPVKIKYRLVGDLAEDGIPVAVTCRVLQIAHQPYYPVAG